MIAALRPLALLAVAGSAPATASTALTTKAASGLPAHVLTGYWQDFTNGAKPLKLSQVPKTYNLVAVAHPASRPEPGRLASRG